MEGFKERVKAFAKAKGLSMREFERRCSITNGLIMSSKNPSLDTLTKIQKAFPDINPLWLASGETEEMFRAPSPNVEKQAGIPFLDGEHVVAGPPSGESQPLEPVEYLNLPWVKFRSGDVAIRAKGRSMIDSKHPEKSIADGDVVCLSPWLENYFEWGEIYCLATRSGYTIKRLKPCDDKFFWCVSANLEEGYEPFKMAYEDIINVTKVTAVINVKIL